MPCHLLTYIKQNLFLCLLCMATVLSVSGTNLARGIILYCIVLYCIVLKFTHHTEHRTCNIYQTVKVSACEGIIHVRVYFSLYL